MSAIRPRRSLGVLVAVLAAGLAALVPTGAPAAPAAPGASGASVRPLTGSPAPVHGREALARIDGRVVPVARLNGLTAARLTDILRTDRTAWLDGDDRLYYVDPGAPARRAASPTEPPAYPAASTFSLHSKPGSQHVIFIDFDGATVTGTAWNGEGVTSGAKPGWSLDSDPTTFSADEDAVIQSVWARVAEDYAPFDVDVTTEDPGAAAIDRSGAGDPTYGTRALVTPSAQAATALCGNQCGGVAYVGAFAEISSHALLQPAWIFPQNLGPNDTKAIAEAVAHEVGHNFGLNHDGNSAQGYDLGHGAWGPIMGAPYDVPITQWSKGDYTGANNKEDDVAIIAASAPLRPDEAGDSPAAAGALPAGTAYVTTRSDVDYYALGHCTGPLAVTAAPAPVGPDLDLRLRLVRADGTVLTTADPASAMVDRDTASGLDASLSTTVPEGDYLVAVDGVGNPPWSTGYDDYGSLGAYTLSLTQGTCDAAPGRPGAPQAVSVRAGSDGRSATVRWSAPLSDGGSPVTGYVVTRTGAAAITAPAGATSQVLTGLKPGTAYTVTVAAVNDAGPGTAAIVSVSIPTEDPAAPTLQRVQPGPAGKPYTATVRWKAPAHDGGSPVSRYRVKAFLLAADGHVLHTQRVLVQGSTTMIGVSAPDRQRIAFAVQAGNAVGWSPWTGRSAAVRLR